MKIICERHSCTGCGLCASQCPVSCITMKSRKLGHLFPIIDNKKCFNCGLCQKNCPVTNPIKSHTPKHAYAAWSKDESDYRSSTSGGASSVISQYIISHGGVVYGCAVLPRAIIEHIRIDKKEDLYKIKGSKYVQSSLLNIFPKIKQDVKENRLVLFLGTPCQIAAVKKLFKDAPDNLYLVDLVCHGTPSQKSLHNYLKRFVPLDLLDNITFRSGNKYVINAFSNNGNIFTSSEKCNHRYMDYYMNSFLDGYSIRNSCSQCIFASPNRCSDITIGDFWGLGKELSCEDIPVHKYGISLIMPITEKGQSLFNIISEKMNVFERPIHEAINGNSQLQHPTKKTNKAKHHTARIRTKS